MKLYHQLSDKLLPSADELWERAGAEMRPWNGTEVPFFDVDIRDKDMTLLDESEFQTKRQRRTIGRELLYKVDVNGIDYLSRVFAPYDNRETTPSFTVTSGAAYTTTINGYAHDRAQKLFADTEQPHIQVSAPHSANERGWKEFTRLPETLAEARFASLALAAQTEQAIMSKLSDMHELPRVQVPIGDSRDSITTPGQFPYAHQYGTEILDFDTKARCALDKYGVIDGLPILGWTARTVLGGIGVGLCLARVGELDTLRGTASLNPNFLASTFTGGLRALASEEPLRMMSWAPADAIGHDVIYGRDSIADVRQIRQAWQGHPNVFIKPVNKGNHASLLHPVAHIQLRGRMQRRVEEYEANGGNRAAMDWNYIYGVNPQDWAPLLDSTIAA